MKKILLMLTAVGTLLTACNNDCDHTDYDHNADLVGTWTCLQADFAEALVIAADGSALSTGFDGEDYWENVAGNITVENGTIKMTFEDGDNFKGHFDIVPGVAFSIYTDEGVRFTFKYCENDLADEIVGMWVCNNTLDNVDNAENDMLIQTFNADGSVVVTGYMADVDDFLTNATGATYKVIGDLMFHLTPKHAIEEGYASCIAMRIAYAPNALAYGDVMNLTLYVPVADKVIESTTSFLRVKQNLDLAGKKYDYIKTFVTNVDGLDKDIEFMGFELNFAKMDGVRLDKMLKHLLFAVEFPDAETIEYSCYYNGESMSMDAPIAVEGNKMTVKMSEKNAAYRDIDLYTFQDADCSQMHMYMPTYAFINFFGNMQATIMSQLGQLDLTDAEAVKAVFDSIDEAVNTINVSFVMTSSK